MGQIQDTYSDASKISSRIGTEVSGGALQNKVINNQATLYFDGVNDTAIKTTANYRSGDSSGSITAWIKNEETTSGDVPAGVIFGSFDTATSNLFLALRLWQNRIAIQQRNSDTADLIQGHTIFINDGKWHFVAATSNGTSYELYVDGIKQVKTVAGGADTGDWFSDTSGRDNIAVGVFQGATVSRFWKGGINNVAVYTDTLSESQIQSLYLKETEPSDYNYVDWWKMDEDTGTSLTDQSGTHTLTISGATWVNGSVYIPVGQTISTSNLGKGSIKKAKNFKYTNTQKAGGSRVVYQFSNDNSTWKNSVGKNVTNGGAYSFDGANDEIIIGSNTPSTNISYMAWVIMTAQTASVNYMVVGTANSSNLESNALYLFNNAGQLQIRYVVDNSAGNRRYWSADISMPLNRWNHIAAVQSGATGTPVIYFNGISIPVTLFLTAGTPTRKTAILAIGKYGDGTIGYFQGLIDNVSMYNATLTQTEIISLMHGVTLPSDYGSAVSWWKLDGNANDSVGSNNGTVNGATSVTDWWRLNYSGNAIEDTNVLYFSGSGNYLTLANETNFDFERTNSFSAQVWIRTLSTAVEVIFSKYDTKGYQLLMNTGGVLQLNLLNTTSTNAIRRTVNEKINDGIWHQITFTYNGTSTLAGTLLYLDGILCTTASSDDTLSATILNNVAAQFSGRNGANFNFTGEIANGAIWNDVRTASEVLTDYQNGYIDISDANLISSYTMNEGTGTTITDSEGANAGTLTGGQWIKDEYRPIPAAPSQQTIDLTSLALSPIYIREFRENQNGLYSAKTDEITLEYSVKAGSRGYVVD